ncbi:MAG: glycerol kinase GlpK [Bacteroidota bacterium]|nr:glycerol kinase GlpK [Bacteroidota bacterium]
MNQYILALDQGTTSCRAIIFDKKGDLIAIAQKEFTQYFPHPGWVEHDTEEIWETQLSVAKQAISMAAIDSIQIAAIGITNQRETTVVWDKVTGKAISKAIVWQDRRTSGYCDTIKSQGNQQLIKEKTGLVIDAYFSASKINWILNNVEGAKTKSNEDNLMFGTIDSWLLYKLTGGKIHATDVTNASRTMLFNIHGLHWDQELLEIFDISPGMLPTVKSCSEIYGETETALFGTPIPIAGIAGDQQAALFGQMCIKPGMLKNTYGTGCFIVMNTGNKPVNSQHNLLSTIAWKLDNKVTYALEGGVFVAGAVVQWLRDSLGIIKTSGEVEALAKTVPDNGGVYFVPSFTGLGAPHWDQYARGSIMGLTRGANAGHIARAALESIAFQTMDVILAMKEDAKIDPKELRVDGGAIENKLLMQFQADSLNLKVIIPNIKETTALGAAYFAGLAVGYWSDVNEINKLWKEDAYFIPHNLKDISQQLKGWNKALERSKSWIDEES